MRKHLTLILLLTSFTISSYSQKLLDAVEQRDYETVTKLLQSGEKVNKPNKNGNFALWNAVFNSDVKMVELLLKNGADARQRFKGKDGQIPCLTIAAQEGSLEVCKLLIDAGADPHEKGPVGQTPLRIAARNGRLDIAQYLISLNADVNTLAEDGATPLEAATGKGHIEIVKLLVEKGANMNIQDNDGDFALGEAVKKGQFEVVQYLLSKGADLSLKNKAGSSALDMAKLSGQPKIEELLKNAGAK